MEIAGKNQEEWRKAYFAGQLNDLLDTVSQKTAITDEEMQKLDKYLETLQKERESLKMSLAKYQKTDKIKLPTVDELMKQTKEQKASIEEWEKSREEEYEKAKKIVELAVSTKDIAHTKQYLDWGFKLALYQFHLDVYRVWKDQCYRAKMVDIMDTYGCSRAEAEERSKLLKEYRDYKQAVLFRELVEEAIMLCKKYYGTN